MKPFLQLNLQTPDKKPEDATLPKPEGELNKPLGDPKRLNRIANRAAHKAASVYGRGGSGLFSK
ncbi:MAG TPA: hypothetical protein VF392_12515 [Terracidiphilus sp.]